MSNDAILMLFLFFNLLARTLSVYALRAGLGFLIILGQFVQTNLPLRIVQVLLPPLIYNLVGHTVDISSSYLLHLGIVTHGTDHKTGT